MSNTKFKFPQKSTWLLGFMGFLGFDYFSSGRLGYLFYFAYFAFFGYYFIYRKVKGLQDERMIENYKKANTVSSKIPLFTLVVIGFAPFFCTKVPPTFFILAAAAGVAVTVITLIAAFYYYESKS